MAIPDYQTVMLPLLQLAQDGNEHLVRDAAERLSEIFLLTNVEKAERLPSGSTTVFTNRVSWANTYLKQAGLLMAPKRGQLMITDAGLSFLKTKPKSIDSNLLNQFESFRAFRTRARPVEGTTSAATIVPMVEQTPEDAMAQAYQRLRAELEIELLEQVKAASPAFFERLVVDVLVAMGYGGSRQDAGRAIGKSGDGGIDGMINEDRLGLDIIYIQAKRWDGVVGRPEIQKFAGALQGQRAQKGVFITTSSFTKEAIAYASVITTRIILVDGDMLARLMVDHNVAVARVGLYELKRIDTDYFDGE